MRILISMLLVALLAGCGQARQSTTSAPTPALAAEPAATAPLALSPEATAAPAPAPTTAPAPAPTTAPAPSTTQPAAAQAAPTSVEDLVTVAAQDIDTFWRQRFAELQLSYTPPATVKAYTADQPIETACGQSVPGNAFYCGKDNSIYYDRDLLNSILQTPRSGDFGVVTVIAHEWGHLAQAQLPRVQVPRIGQQVELQADCFAGAYGRYIADGSSSVLQRSRGDLLEGAATLFSFGDQLPWFNPQAHGSPKQRAASYGEGLRSFDNCLRR